MSTPARVVAAGLASLALVLSHAVYRQWPAWRGVEVYLPAALVPAQPARARYVRVDLPAERLVIEPARPDPDRRDTFEPVRRVGAWWGPAGDEAASAWRVRGRRVFVQLEEAEPMWPGGPAWMRPVAVADAPIDTARNIAATVGSAERSGRLQVSFGSHELLVPREVAARARPRATGRVAPGSPVTYGRDRDPGVFAVFRVLPSGRAGLVGLIVDGRRID